MKEQNIVIENLFRKEYGKIIAVLLHKFGPSHLESIEDAVQDALLKAMQMWGFKGIPESPTAWLLRVANNGLIDRLRRDRKIMPKGELPIRQGIIDREMAGLEITVTDSQLKMLFACCHPALSVDYQIILSLKLIGGFGNKEIARALLKKEDTVAKSFTRAKERLKDQITTLDIPLEMGLQSRLAIVLKVIYLLFSEGYSASAGATVIKKDICLEAIRLALLLKDNKFCDHANVHALIALMCFHTSRFEARVDLRQELVDLEHQDRNKYDRALIKIGVQHLQQAGTDDRLPSNYHLEAAVSFYHCTAESFSNTDWKKILFLYDLQLKRQYSPVVELNRIVPFHKVFGAEKAMAELRHYEKSPHVIKNALYHAIAAELYADLGHTMATRKALKRAIGMTQNELEKRHLSKKLERQLR